MRVERQYRELEKVEEVRVYNIDWGETYNPSPPAEKPEKIRFSNVIRHVPSDINIFKPIDDGNDFIIVRIGWNFLERSNTTQEDVAGRKLSQLSPFYYKIFGDALREVYKTRKTKAMRVFYYLSNKIQTLANINITYDEGEIYLVI